MVYSSGSLLLLGRADALSQDPLNHSLVDILLVLKSGRIANYFMQNTARYASIKERFMSPGEYCQKSTLVLARWFEMDRPNGSTEQGTSPFPIPKSDQRASRFDQHPSALW